MIPMASQLQFIKKIHLFPSVILKNLQILEYDALNAVRMSGVLGFDIVPYTQWCRQDFGSGGNILGGRPGRGRRKIFENLPKNS